MIPPNIALLAWPLVAIWLFKILPFERAIIWSVLGSFLFLPSSFAIDFPGLPPMDKQSLPNLALLLIVLFMAPKRFRILPENLFARFLVVLLFVGTALTALTNSDPILIAGTILPGLTAYDALSSTVRTLLTIIPFLVGWQYLASSDSQRAILVALLTVGLGYSVLMLFEVRMSPQLHIWVYGYFPHSLAQQIRDGGFRPVVFLVHGLWVAFFAMTIMLAAAALWRQTKQDGRMSAQGHSTRYLLAAGYLGVVLFLCKSLGSLIFGLIFLPIVLFFSTRAQVLIAAILVIVAIGYPVLRGAGLVPTDTLLSWATSIDPERASSLEIRLTNEQMLLDHSEARAAFGWGGWGRNRIFDAETGQDISTTDGYWAIIIGREGWVGYIAIFGLLGFPVLASWRRSRRDSDMRITPVSSALCLLLGINMIELLPNSTLPPWTWLIAGAVLGHATQTQVQKPQPTDSAPHALNPQRTIL